MAFGGAARGAWIASPAIARWISRSPKIAGRVSVSAADAQTLRLIARRTWRFFETFVTAADNMLPPDNFQEDPVPALAHRTSPTNLGLYLLSVAAARDFWMAGNGRSGGTPGDDPGHHGQTWRGFADISTIGTIRATCARSIRPMSPRSIVGTWPAI